MPITAQCPGCTRQYRVKDEMAGRRVRCKDCGTDFVVSSAEPEPVAAAFAPAPPPSSPPPLPAQAAPLYPSQPAPFASGYIAPPAKSSSGKIIGIVVGVVLLVAGVGGILKFLEHEGIALPWASEAAIRPKLIAKWKIVHAAGAGNATGYIAFHNDNTFQTELNIGMTTAKFTGTWELKGRDITLVIGAVQFGKQSVVGQRFPYGRVVTVNDTQLVLGTKNGAETYARSK